MPLPFGALNKLEDQRQQLIQWVESRAPQGSARNAVTVVFDGRTDVWSPSASSSTRVIFAQGQSADDKIVQMVEEADHRKNIVVVTDDRSLQRLVRALGAKVSDVQTFLGQGASTSVRRPESGKNISKTLEHKITSEFTGIWIEKKKGKKA